MTAATVRAWAALVGGEVDQRAQAEVGGGDRDGRPHPAQRGAGRPGQRLEDRQDRRRHRAGGGGRGLERGQFVGIGQVPDGDEVPDLVEAVVASEVGGVEAAVVVAALVAEDVADAGLGHGDAVEAGGNVDERGHGPIVALGERR